MRKVQKKGRNITEKNYNNAYYNNSSVAYDYNDDKENYEQRRRKNIEKRKKQKRVKIKTVNEQTVHSFRVYFTAFVVFGFSIFIIASNAFVADQKIQIQELKNELKQIDENNSNLKNELTKNLDLKEVEKLASDKLGMQMPADYQIVYIDVPQQSYTVKHGNNSEDIDNIKSFNIVRSIKNILGVD